MTYRSSSGASAPDKTYSHHSLISAIALEAGLVRHPLVSATDQVQILRAIDETGSASVGDVMAVLEPHEDSVGAIVTLIEAGLIRAELTHGVFDEHARLMRTIPLPPDEDPDPTAPDGAMPPKGPAPLGVVDSEAQVRLDAAIGAAQILPEGLSTVPVSQFFPSIHVGQGAARRAFAACEVLQRPGVYILMSDTSAYVGMGSVVRRRVASGAQPIEDVDTIITITDAHNGLDDADAAVLERILHMRVGAAKEVRLLNGTPGGAPVTPERYRALNVMAGIACDALARDGHLFINMSPRLALAGPRAELGQLMPPRPFNTVPEGEVMELAFGRNLIALAARRADDDWLLLAGSNIRLDTVASANASASYLRAAWLHSGLLELSETGESYVLTRDLTFRSAGAAMHFVIGSKGQGRGGWQPMDPTDGSDAEALVLAAG
ncbi:MAG TPA: hypothetical protein VIL88_13730 [Devosia sp.]|jgi:hypothetical protein|uniref:hypothetical protein n=1 Tax=Devosia sp. TaxID=1871048 RepID=UPI002F937AB8